MELRGLLASGDQKAAVERLELALGREISAWVERMIRPHEAAEEVVAQIHFCMARSIKNLDAEDSARGCASRGWAFAIAKNECWRFLRQENDRRLREQPLSSGWEGQIDDSKPGLSTDVRERDLLKKRLEALHDALKELPEDEAALVILRGRDGLSFREIAEHFSAGGEEVTETSLRKRFERATKRLELALAPLGLG